MPVVEDSVLLPFWDFWRAEARLDEALGVATLDWRQLPAAILKETSIYGRTAPDIFPNIHIGDTVRYLVGDCDIGANMLELQRPEMRQGFAAALNLTLDTPCGLLLDRVSIRWSRQRVCGLSLLLPCRTDAGDYAIAVLTELRDMVGNRVVGIGPFEEDPLDMRIVAHLSAISIDLGRGVPDGGPDFPLTGHVGIDSAEAAIRDLYDVSTGL